MSGKKFNESNVVIDDWEFVEIYHGAGPMMYVRHHCTEVLNNTDKGGNITRCNRCKTAVPDHIKGLLTLYNWNHPWNLLHPCVKSND